MIRLRLRTASASRRRGLTYLEVLMAAAIGLVGMLGAIALFPVAFLQLQRGIQADTSNMLGEAAIHQAETLGISDPKKWMFYAGASPPVATPVPLLPLPATQQFWLPVEDSTLYQVRRECGNRPWNLGVNALSSFCIDPRFVAEMMYQSSGPATAAQTAGQYYWRFPYTPEVPQLQRFPNSPDMPSNDTDDVRMWRISLMNPISNAPLSLEQARLFFKSSDDLIFDRQAKDTLGVLPAAQSYMSSINGGVKQNSRRDYMAEYEWIATLVPKFSGQGAQVVGQPSQVVASGDYVLSVVVLHKRRPKLDTILVSTSSDPFAEDERVVDVTNFYGNGLGGGDVEVATRQRLMPDGTTASMEGDLLVRENDWALLGGMMKQSDNTGVTLDLAPIFQWYRVTGVQGESNSLAGGRYSRVLTLQGGDWPMTSGNNRAYVQKTQMTFVSGVVGVFERTVRLQTGDLW